MTCVHKDQIESKVRLILIQDWDESVVMLLVNSCIEWFLFSRLPTLPHSLDENTV